MSLRTHKFLHGLSTGLFAVGVLLAVWNLPVDGTWSLSRIIVLFIGSVCILLLTKWSEWITIQEATPSIMLEGAEVLRAEILKQGNYDGMIPYRTVATTRLPEEKKD